MPSSPVVYDTLTSRRGERGRIHVEYKDRNRRTYIPYSSGHEVVMEQVAPGDGKRIGPAGVRVITKITNPHTAWFTMPKGFGAGRGRLRFGEPGHLGEYTEEERASE